MVVVDLEERKARGPGVKRYSSCYSVTDKTDITLMSEKKDPQSMLHVQMKCRGQAGRIVSQILAVRFVLLRKRGDAPK